MNFRNRLIFYGEELLAPRPTPKLEDHPLSAVRTILIYSASYQFCTCFFLIGIVGGGVQLDPLGTAATIRPIVPVPSDYDDGEIGGMIVRGNRSTRRKPAPVPLYPPQTSHAARTPTRAVAVGSQRLTA
jgi:hypothetical protein